MSKGTRGTETQVAGRPILIIDDEPDLCSMLGLVFSAAGFKAVSAHDGLSGIELAERTQPAVILLDIIMPGLDGVSTCRRLKQNPILRRIPVVGMTASTVLGYTERGFRAGAEFFLAKPCGRESLLQVLSLATQRAHREAGQRVHRRFRAAFPVRCLVLREGKAAREVGGQTGNVSLDGLLLYLREPLAPQMVLRIEVKVPEGTVTVEGALIWKGGPIDDLIIPHGVQLLGFVQETDFARYQCCLAELA